MSSSTVSTFAAVASVGLIAAVFGCTSEAEPPQTYPVGTSGTGATTGATGGSGGSTAGTTGAGGSTAGTTAAGGTAGTGNTSGTGTAPLRALLQATLRAGDSGSLILLCGFRSERDVLWRDEFETLARANSRFDYALTLSQPDPGWQGLQGRVQEHAVELARRLERPTVFLCGGLAMVGEVQTLLEERAGVPTRDIFAEGY